MKESKFRDSHLSVSMPFLSIFIYFVFAFFFSGALFFSNPFIKGFFYLCFVALLYAHIIEPYLLQIKKIKFTIPTLKKTKKIVLIADLQVRKLKNRKWLNRVINKIIILQPDYVFIAGDFIFNQTKSGVNEPAILLELKRLTQLVPVFAVLGNHEYGRNYVARLDKSIQQYPDRSLVVITSLREAGVRIVRNELVEFENFTLYGTDDLWSGNASWENLQNIPTDKPLLVLTHNPDTILNYPSKIKTPSLVLAGHTHGGQVRLPFIGPLGPMQIKLGRKFDRGFKTYNDIPLFITHGLGESDLSLRFMVVPEIVELTLSST